MLSFAIKPTVLPSTHCIPMRAQHSAPLRRITLSNYKDITHVFEEKLKTPFPLGVHKIMDDFCSLHKKRDNKYHRHFVLLMHVVDGKEYTMMSSNRFDDEANTFAYKVLNNIVTGLTPILQQVGLLTGTCLRLDLNVPDHYVVYLDTYQEEHDVSLSEIKNVTLYLSSEHYRWFGLERYLPVWVRAAPLVLSTIFNPSIPSN